ncbi:hypothetical protein [Arthrobacter sunyaminii]|uniref:hypothetical protein n=1 Tax=Arthrobacter sunyaminii TaxID=2816859 RepID=UPI001A94805D|nr:hypothetical protein [Arthrobacter sunyaminii]MBO0896468.1 hypothetical protein [Arthrobacter sunyaminii]
MTGACAVGAVAAAVSLAGAPAALAADGYLEFSLDGTTYGPSIPGPLFNESLQYVPGASTGATIWIRNNSGEPARLSSAAVMVRSDPQLHRQLGLTAGLKSDVPVRSALGAQGSCTDVNEIWELESGEELELSFVVDLSPDAPNDTMNRSADFDVVFLLESKDAAPRQACDALVGPSQPTAGSKPGQGNSAALTGASSSRPVTVSGTSGSAPTATPAGIFPAGMPERPAEAGSPQAIVPGEHQPAAIVPAGFQSTVEPIIRSLSGTLLIALSVVFTAVIVLRIRNRSV